MAEDIKDLIEKIQQEGIQAAEEKARQIEEEAHQRAEAILSRARSDADQMISAAGERIRREEEREKALLDQAGRDLLLFLREEINAMLHRIVVSDIHQIIAPEHLSSLLSDLIRDYKTEEGTDIIVALNEKDLERMENTYLHKLCEETKRGIILRPAHDIQGGFTISFDNGRSCYDFSDKALADYIVKFLKPKLKNILQGSSGE